METSSTDPLVVVQTSPHGRRVVLGLAYERERTGEGEAVELATEPNSGRAMGGSTTSLVERESNGESGSQLGASTARGSSRWADLRTRLSCRSRESGAIQPRVQFCPPSTTIDRLVPFLSEDLSPKTQEQAAKQMAEISSVDEYRSTIAGSSQAMAGLSRLLFSDSPCSCYAAVALGNLAAVEGNLQCFKGFPYTLTGLVRLLFRYDDGLAQREAAVAVANLSHWREGGTMILETPQAIEGLVGLVTVTQNVGGNRNGSKEEAKRALLNLSLLRKNRPILDSAISLAALTRCLNIHDKDDRSASSSSPAVMQKETVGALARLSYNIERAKEIAKSNEFPLCLAVLVRFLVNSSSPTAAGSLEPAGASTVSDSLAVRITAATALANLSITEAIQLMVAEFPNSLAGLFMSLRVHDGASPLALQLQECAAAALGNLALARDNRRKIVDFGGADGLAGLASVLFQDDNPGGQEYAAWALGNLSHDSHDSEDIAVKIAASPNILIGLARLLQLPTKPSELGIRSRVGAQEQAVRALANLAYPHASQVKIARVPNMVKALAAAVLSRRCHQDLSAMIQEHAVRALANLTRAKKNWRSSEFFADALRALVDVVSIDNVEASLETRKYGALALGNFARAPAHHRAIVDSKQAMTGLVRMLFSWDAAGVGKEQAAWTLANLANGDLSVKAAIARFPLAVTGLIGLLFDGESPLVQDQAKRALVGLRDYDLDVYTSTISAAAGGSCDAVSSNYGGHFSMFELASRAEACI